MTSGWQAIAEHDLPVIRWGTAMSAVALAAALVELILESVSAGAGVVLAWVIVAMVCAAVMTGICSFQWWASGRVVAAEDAVVETRAGRLRPVSWWLHIGSYLVVLVGMFAMLNVLVGVVVADGRTVLMLCGVLALVLGQVIGATRHLRVAGPPGTLATHLARLRKLEQRRIGPPE